MYLITPPSLVYQLGGLMSMFLIKKKLKTDELLLTRKYWIDSPSSSLVIDEKIQW